MSLKSIVRQQYQRIANDAMHYSGHGQWILKFEWNRVKIEAASGSEWRKLKHAEIELQRDYAAFLERDGSLHRLDAIEAGKDALDVTLLRSEMDVEEPVASAEA